MPPGQAGRKARCRSLRPRGGCPLWARQRVQARSGVDMLDRERRLPERRVDPHLLLAEALGPGGVVDPDDSLRLDLSDEDFS
jgi:hypothetical protein